MKVLIADDELNNRRLLSLLLRKFGECVLAKNGEEAVALFHGALENNVPFNLVLMDIEMPFMDGQEALKRIRDTEKTFMERTPNPQKWHYTTAFMVTSHNDMASMSRSYNQGRCDGYIIKPVHKDDLLHRLKKHGLISTDIP